MLLQTLALRVLHRERRLSTGSVTQFCFNRIQDASTEDVDTAIDNDTEQKKSRPRGKVPRLNESGNRRNNELGRTHGKKNNYRGRRKPTTYRATRSMGQLKRNRRQTPVDLVTEEEISTWDSFSTRKDTDNTKQKQRSDGRDTMKTKQKHFEKLSKQNGRVWCDSRQ